MSLATHFYLAAPSSDLPRAERLMQRISDATGAKVTFDWVAHIRSGAEPNAEAAWRDLRAVREADFIVVLDGPSRGASVELGHAMAYRRPIFIVSATPDMWAQAAGTAEDVYVFTIQRICATEDELITQLRTWFQLDCPT